jgi:hypothetical protein
MATLLTEPAARLAEANAAPERNARRLFISMRLSLSH